MAAPDRAPYNVASQLSISEIYKTPKPRSVLVLDEDIKSNKGTIKRVGFDSRPTRGSKNLITSGDLYDLLYGQYTDRNYPRTIIYPPPDPGGDPQVDPPGGGGAQQQPILARSVWANPEAVDALPVAVPIGTGLEFASGTLRLAGGAAGAAWAQDGNTLAAEKWLGTISNHALPIRTNNVERIRIESNGMVTVTVPVKGSSVGGSWTATANNDYHMNFGGSFTGLAAGGTLHAYRFSPSLIALSDSNNQELYAVALTPTFTWGGTPDRGASLLINPSWTGTFNTFVAGVTVLANHTGSVNGLKVINSGTGSAFFSMVATSSATIGSADQFYIERFNGANGNVDIANSGTGLFMFKPSSGQMMAVGSTGVLIASSGSIATSTRLDVRGVNDTTGNIIRLANQSNVELCVLTGYGEMTITGQRATGTYAVLTVTNSTNNGGSLRVGPTGAGGTYRIDMRSTAWYFDVINSGGYDVFFGSVIPLAFNTAYYGPVILHGSLNHSEVTGDSAVHSLVVSTSASGTSSFRGGVRINSEHRIGSASQTGAAFGTYGTLSFDSTNALTSSVYSGLDIATVLSAIDTSNKALVTYRSAYLRPTYNYTAGTSIVYGIDYSPTETSMTGVTHYAFRSTSSTAVVLLGGTTATTNTRLDVRGTGTTTEIIQRWADSTNVLRSQILANGNFLIGSSAAGSSRLEIVNDTAQTYILRLRGSLATDVFRVRNGDGVEALSGNVNQVNPGYFQYWASVTFTHSSDTSEAYGYKYRPTFNTSGGVTTFVAFEYDPIVTALQAQDVNTALRAKVGGLTLNGKTSPSTITGDQDNYNPTGLHQNFNIRLNSDASRNITGMVKGQDGEFMFVHNVGGFDLVFKNENTSSSEANRFALNSDLTLKTKQSTLFWYDSTSTRWRAIQGGGGGWPLTGTGTLTGSVEMVVNPHTLVFSYDDATTSTVIVPVSLRRSTSGTAAAGIGTGINFEVESATNGSYVTASLEHVLTNAALASADSKIDFRAYAGGSSKLFLTIDKGTILKQYDAGVNKLVLERNQIVADGTQITGVQFEGASSTGANRVYAEIDTYVADDTNGAEDGRMKIRMMYGGSLEDFLMMDNTGMYLNPADGGAELAIGGSNISVFGGLGINYQSMAGGMYFNSTSTPPNANPSNGYFQYIVNEPEGYNQVIRTDAGHFAKPVLQKKVTIAGGSTLRSIGSSAQTIIAAPGTNKYLNIISVAISYNYGAAAYDFAAGEIPQFEFSGSSGGGWRIPVSIMNGTTDVNRILAIHVITATDYGLTAPGNTAFVLTTDNGGDATTGDGDLDVVVYYTVEDVNT